MTLYDSVTAANIPSSATQVAGYIDGRYKWTDADWARFPNATLKLKISAIPFNFAADVCDCETGDYTPAQAAEWAVNRKTQGLRPVIYCSVSVKPSVVEQLNARGLADTDVDWWEAHYTGQPHMEPGSEATQYADPGPYDLSETAPGWTADQTPAPLAPSSPGKDQEVIVVRHPDGAAVLIVGEQPIGIPDGADLIALQGAGVGVANVTADFYAAVNNALNHPHTA